MVDAIIREWTDAKKKLSGSFFKYYAQRETVISLSNPGPLIFRIKWALVDWPKVNPNQITR